MTKKFNKEVTNQILSHMRAGTSFEHAAKGAGVDRVTLWRWIRQGESDDMAGKRTLHAKFAQDFAKADATVVGKVERWLVTQAELDVRAATWFLSKRAPRVYGDKELPELAELKQRGAAELLFFLQKHVSPAAFDEVLHALSRFGDSELDPKALPVPA